MRQPNWIIFVQNTANSELGNEVKKVINTLKPWTGIGLKVVERVGDKLEDLLHKSNPWENVDCERDKCLTCKTSTESEKLTHKNCKKRSVVYETWCKICENPVNDNTENPDDENATEVVNENIGDKREREVTEKKGM